MALISSCSPCHRHMSLNSCRDMCRGSWDALGPLWDMCRGGLGPSWGSFVDALAPPWEHLEALLGRLEASWDMCRAPWGPPGEKNRGGWNLWTDFGTENGDQFCQVGLAGLQISCAQPVFCKEFSGTCPFQVMSSQGHVPEAWGPLHPLTPRWEWFKRHIRRSLHW